MVRFQTRLLTATYVAVDAVVTALAWLAAYYVRFDSDLVSSLVPITKGVPDAARYLVLAPALAVLLPAVGYFYGLYRLRRGKSRIDEFFGILFTVLIASFLTLGATLYVRVYYQFEADVAPGWEFSQAVFGIFVVLDVLLLTLARQAIRSHLERQWAAGHNVRRLAIAGAGALGRTVAETIQAHRELGFKVIGFIDDVDETNIDGLPVLARLDQTAEALARHEIDQLYLALPLEEHARLLSVIKAVSNECVDIKVVPDLLQYASARAALEDLDGIPIISLNEVPLHGLNSMLKRLMDAILASLGLGLLSVSVFPVIWLLIRLKGGPGPVFLRQERMSLDGKPFEMYKFRTMVESAESETGPVWASPEDPRRTSIGVWLRRFNLDELPQLINVLLGDMSLVGPRPERPPFVRQFKERIPQYMLRHRVKSGITGWAQVNGWRGNTSLEKRIEYDLYYIENWSLLLDVKILLLTLTRGFGQKHAY